MTEIDILLKSCTPNVTVFIQIVGGFFRNLEKLPRIE